MLPLYFRKEETNKQKTPVESFLSFNFLFLHLKKKTAAVNKKPHFTGIEYYFVAYSSVVLGKNFSCWRGN